MHFPIFQISNFSTFVPQFFNSQQNIPLPRLTYYIYSCRTSFPFFFFSTQLVLVESPLSTKTRINGAPIEGEGEEEDWLRAISEAFGTGNAGEITMCQLSRGPFYSPIIIRAVSTAGLQRTTGPPLFLRPACAIPPSRMDGSRMAIAYDRAPYRLIKEPWNREGMLDIWPFPIFYPRLFRPRVQFPIPPFRGEGWEKR